MQTQNEAIQALNAEAKSWAMEGFAMPSGEYAPVRITALGLEVVQDMTLEQVRELLLAFKNMDSVCALNLSDLLAYGHKTFGAEQMELLLEEVSFDYSVARKAISLMDIPAGLRHVKLNKEHYFVVSALTYVEQAKWLKLTIEEDLTPLELKRSIEAGLLLRKGDISDLSGSNSGISTYQAVITGFERWCKKVGGTEKITAWADEHKRRWLQDMSSVVSLIETVRKSLNGGLV
jgi:hypothetical protein